MTQISYSVALLSALLLHPLRAQALLPDLPRQTTAIDEVLDPRGWTPRPTDHPLDLFKRQNFPTFPGDNGKVLVAPDHVCGYISGKQGAPFNCSSKFKCLFFPATGTSYGPMACCTSGMNCKIRTACVASADYFGPSSNSFCNAGCKMDRFTLKCTNSDEPYCASIRFKSPNIQDYWCVSDSASATTFHEATTTFPGQKQRVFTTLDKTDLWQEPTRTTTSNSRTSSGTDSSPTDDDGTNAPPVEDGNNSQPVGAIIGGVLGGITVVALIGFGAFILYRHYRKPSHLPVASDVPLNDPYTGYTGYTGHTELDSRSSYTDNGQQPPRQYYDPPKPVAALPPQELQGHTMDGRYSPVEMGGQEIRK